MSVVVTIVSRKSLGGFGGDVTYIYGGTSSPGGGEFKDVFVEDMTLWDVDAQEYHAADATEDTLFLSRTQSYDSLTISLPYLKTVLIGDSFEGDGKTTPITLKNETTNIINDSYYGTDGDGVKGYHSIDEIIRTIIEDPNGVIQTTINTLVVNQSDNISENAIVTTSETSYIQHMALDVNSRANMMGNLHCVVVIHDLSSSGDIVTVKNVMGFDYLDGSNESLIDSKIVTDASINLALGIDSAGVFTATLTGMTANSKRIHFCFQRCTTKIRNYKVKLETGYFILTGYPVSYTIYRDKVMITTTGYFGLTGYEIVLPEYKLVADTAFFTLTAYPNSSHIITYKFSVDTTYFTLTGKDIEYCYPQLMDGLVAYYKFEEVSGPALDSVGGNDIPTFGTVPRVSTTRPGDALNFDGNYLNYLERAAHPLNGAIDHTITFWVRIETFGTFDYVMDSLPPAGNYYSKAVYLSTPYVYAATTTNTGRTSYSLILNPTISQWNLVTLRTRRTATGFDYAHSWNDTIVSSGSYVSAGIEFMSQLVLGRDTAGTSSRSFHGYIADLKLYNRYLTECDWLGNYNEGAGRRVYIPFTHKLSAQTGLFTMTGYDASLLISQDYVLTAEQGSFALTGYTASFPIVRCIEYGALYNIDAVIDVRGIANTGWHIFTKTERDLLITNLGGVSVAGGKLKEVGLEHWLTPNTGATDEVGFTALSGGYRISSGYDGRITKDKVYWTSTFSFESGGIYYYYAMALSYNSAGILYPENGYNSRYGYSVRLMKDSTSLSEGEFGTYTGNNGVEYVTVCIGDGVGGNLQEYTIQDLAETLYANGDPITYVDGDIIGEEDWEVAVNMQASVMGAYLNVLTNVSCHFTPLSTGYFMAAEQGSFGLTGNDVNFPGSYYGGTGGIGSTSTTTLSVPYPANIESGDRLYMQILSSDGSTLGITAPSGWSLSYSGSCGNAYSNYTKIATGSESGNLDITCDDTYTHAAVMYQYKNAGTMGSPDQGCASNTNEKVVSGKAGVTFQLQICHFATDEVVSVGTAGTGWVENSELSTSNDGGWTFANATYRFYTTETAPNVTLSFGSTLYGPVYGALVYTT